MKKKKFIITELGKEKLCCACDEYWPANEEFFYKRGDVGLHSYCKACYQERRKELRAGAPRKANRRSRAMVVKQ